MKTIFAPYENLDSNELVINDCEIKLIIERCKTIASESHTVYEANIENENAEQIQLDFCKKKGFWIQEEADYLLSYNTPTQSVMRSKNYEKDGLWGVDLVLILK